MAHLSKKRKELINGKGIQAAHSKSGEQDTLPDGQNELRREDSIARDDAIRAELKNRAANPLGDPGGDFPF